MKLLALCGFLFVCLLCFNVFAVEGQKVRRRCCSKVHKRNKNLHEGISFKITPVETRRHCKPCPRRPPVPPQRPGPLPQRPGPLPQLK